MEGWLSGPKRGVANPLSRKTRTGSNPVPSAFACKKIRKHIMKKSLTDKKSYCTFYIVRHGQTEWNLKKLVQGHTDIPLTKTGEKQAKDLAKKLNKVEFAMVFSSDLLRAKRTAELIVLEKKIAVKTTKALRERYFGRFEGVKWQENKEYKKLIDNFLSLSKEERFKKKPFEDTESDEELVFRFITFLREVAVAYRDKNILVVTHGGTMRAFINHLGNDLKSGSIDNTAYLVVDSDGIDFFIKGSFGIQGLEKITD